MHTRTKRLIHTWTPRLKRHWPVLVLAVLNIILFITNYKPGTFLIGWDNLYPELAPFLNIQRSFFATWQEYRNLGYMDGMSHAANLFHDVARWLLSTVFPLHLVRWITIFGTHFLGGVGMYYLLHRYVFRSFHAHKRALFVSLFGALFYQYNLITVQQYFLPYELFLFHFASLPWLVFATLLYMEHGKKKYLVAYTVALFISIPQAHVPTIFIVTALILAFVMISKLLIMKGQSWKQMIVLILISFTVNAYWGIPFAFATSQNAQEIAESKNNQMATDNIFYLNQKYGSFTDVALLKGVVLEYQQYDIQLNQNFYMMAPWIEHMETLPFQIPAWIFFLLTMIGLGSAFYLRKQKYAPFTILFVFSFAMMAVDTPVISILSDLLREHIPLFHNVFRFVFTKFAFFYVFSYTIFLALGLYYLLTAIGHTQKSVRRSRYLRSSTFTVMIVLLIMYGIPSFQQHFFYRNLATEVPDAYFDTFDFFSSVNPDDRVALLPIPWYWAWTQNNWNTIGSGFFWYGLEQPTTDRAFDPWSSKNENFYWELEQAVFSDNEFLLEKVLDKYDIRWLILDESVYNNSSPKFSLSEYADLINRSERMNRIVTHDFLSIYQFEQSIPQENQRMQIKTSLPNIIPSYEYDNVDMAHIHYGDYITMPEEKADLFYPFRSLFSGRKPQDREFTLRETETEIIFEAVLPYPEKNVEVSAPNLYPNEFIRRPFETDLSTTTSAQMEIRYHNKPVLSIEDTDDLDSLPVTITTVPGGVLQVVFEKDSLEWYSRETDPKYYQRRNDGCQQNLSPDSVSTLEAIGRYLVFTSVQSDNCLLIPVPELSHNVGYLMFVEAQNSDIRGLFVNVINHTTRKSDLETYLQKNGADERYHFVIPPRAFDGLGYSIAFNNQSIAREEVENTLTDLEIYQIPYFFLKELSVQPIGQSVPRSETISSSVAFQQYNPTLYSVDHSIDSDDRSSDLLYLSQGFSPFWQAYEFSYSAESLGMIDLLFPFISGSLITDHYSINNWANGWVVDHSSATDQQAQADQSIVLVFWPQYILYAGLIVTASTILLLYVLPSSKKHASAASTTHTHTNQS